MIMEIAWEKENRFKPSSEISVWLTEWDSLSAEGTHSLCCSFSETNSLIIAVTPALS